MEFRVIPNMARIGPLVLGKSPQVAPIWGFLHATVPVAGNNEKRQDKEYFGHRNASGVQAVNNFLRLDAICFYTLEFTYTVDSMSHVAHASEVI